MSENASLDKIEEREKESKIPLQFGYLSFYFSSLFFELDHLGQVPFFVLKVPNQYPRMEKQKGQQLTSPAKRLR